MSERKPRLLLSGTSNSILAKGLNFPLGLSPDISVFTNQSYGASGSIALGDHLSKIDFSLYDFCLLDYCVNEEVLISLRQSSVNAAINNIMAVVSAASVAGCQPILLILPTLTRINHLRPFEDAIMSEFVARGVPVFNFYTFAKKILLDSELAFEDLFLDPMHIHRELGAFVSSVVLEYILSINADPRTTVELTDVTYDPLKFVPFKDFRIVGDHEVVTRSSRLTSLDLLRVSPGSTISFDIPSSLKSGASVVGISCNLARSIGNLLDTNTGEVCTTIKSLAQFKEARALTMVGLPIKAPPKGEAQFTFLYEYEGIREVDQPEAAMEISGFVIRSTDPQTSIPLTLLTRRASTTYIHDHVSEGQLTALVSMLQELKAQTR